MIERLEDLNINMKINKNHLRDVVKYEAKNIHMKDIMLAASFLREDAKYMPKSYREDYINRFSKAFFTRIKDIKEDKNNYPGYVNIKKLVEFLMVVDKQSSDAVGDNEKCFIRIAKIIATYTTFILEEPIHPIGTKFPGGFVLHQYKGLYLCPVKNRQLNNPSALCKFCVSVQDESVD
ncbi:MAG: DUF2115 domain-containing protein [Methanobacterium sp.]